MFLFSFVRWTLRFSVWPATSQLNQNHYFLPTSDFFVFRFVLFEISLFGALEQTTETNRAKIQKKIQKPHFQHSLPLRSFVDDDDVNWFTDCVCVFQLFFRLISTDFDLPNLSTFSQFFSIISLVLCYVNVNENGRILGCVREGMCVMSSDIKVVEKRAAGSFFHPPGSSFSFTFDISPHRLLYEKKEH